MAPFYRATCEQLGWEMDSALLTQMETSNAAELSTLAEKLKDAEENEGESEIAAALLARAEFYQRVGNKAETLKSYGETFKKTVALGPKLDLVLAEVRVALFFDDLKLAASTIERAKALLEDGGDWERRNRLKVYEAVYLIAIRSFAKASSLLLDSIATFTATELVSYNDFVMYTVVASLIAVPRAEIKLKVIEAPEILQVIGEVPHLAPLLNGLYDCQYSTLMRALVHMTEALKADRYLHQHARFYSREVRVLAYAQFLESYRSVSTAAMAQSFGISSETLDQDLSGFIATSRLCCKIDKVNGVVSSTRPDLKNALYQSTIKQGDLLLNRLQKLSRVINV